MTNAEQAQSETEGRALSDEVGAYLVCALWSSHDDDGDPLNSRVGVDDVAPEAVEVARTIVSEFLNAHPADCETWTATFGAGQIGHDLWLTRNGHGTGFWDRPGDAATLAAGQRLSDAARTLGESDPYLGEEDGMVYFR